VYTDTDTLSYCLTVYTVAVAVTLPRCTHSQSDCRCVNIHTRSHARCRNEGAFLNTGKSAPPRTAAEIAADVARPATAAACSGAFQGLTRNQKISLVEYARTTREANREKDAVVSREHDEYWEQKREATRVESLSKLEAKYLETILYWEMREERRTTIAEVTADLRTLDAKSRKVQYLKDAIKIRVIGFGWSELHVAWSAGGVDKTVVQLTAELAAILEEEETREVPTVAPVPSLKRKTFKQLGAPIEQLEELSAAFEVDNATFQQAADVERRRREADFETDAHQRRQPHAPPAVEQLRNVRIEYLDVIYVENKKVLHWFAGVVHEVSDGSKPKGGRSKKKWAAGFARVEYDAQPALGEDETTESWVALRANKFNGNAKGCWRLDLD